MTLEGGRPKKGDRGSGVSGCGNQAIRGSGIDPMANDAFSMSSVFSEALMLFEKTKPIFLSPGSQSHDDNLYKFVSLWLSGEKRVKSYQKLSKNYKNAQKRPKTASIFTIPCRKKPNYHVDPRSPAVPSVSLGDKFALSDSRRAGLKKQSQFLNGQVNVTDYETKIYARSSSLSRLQKEANSKLLPLYQGDPVFIGFVGWIADRDLAGAGDLGFCTGL